jgi:hypothetical protein
MKNNRIFFIVNLILAVFFIINAIRTPIYIFDGVLYLALVMVFWRYGKKLNQTTLSMGLIFLAAFLHNMGVFGTYSAITHYDKFMHFLSGAVITYALFRFIHVKEGYKTAVFLALIGAIGVTIVGEVSEFTGYNLAPLSPLFEGGLLDPGVSAIATEKATYSDTMWDVIFDFMGALSAAVLLLSSANYLKSKSKR